MSEKEAPLSAKGASRSNTFFTFLGIIGGFTTFGLILFVAYLPNRPPPVDQAVVQQRQAKADASRTAGSKKLRGFEVVDKAAGVVRIPIEEAMDLTVRAYRDGANR